MDALQRALRVTPEASSPRVIADAMCEAAVKSNRKCEFMRFPNTLGAALPPDEDNRDSPRTLRLVAATKSKVKGRGRRGLRTSCLFLPGQGLSNRVDTL